ncbi:MAG: DUF3943 domain-containing protein [Paramuribaculum sp.]|nr:DUF3943 domain-containing protein [Paramuribaculum sp.]
MRESGLYIKISAMLIAVALIYFPCLGVEKMKLESIGLPKEAYSNSPATIRPDAVVPVVFTDKQKVDVYRNMHLTLYDLPYSRTLSMPNWTRLWVNTGVLIAGGITTMLILESLPEDATAWNRAANNRVPLFKRYINHIKAGPVWDGDKFIFNYVLHPYGGAAYYMSARSCGFNCWGSFLYSFCISTFFWEYGFEAFNEVPSVQDLVITPVVGSVMGECFYKLKRHIVSNGYRLWGSPVLGYFVAFLCDPVNEVVGYFRGEQRRASRLYKSRATTSVGGGFSIVPTRSGYQTMFNLAINF